MTYISTKGNIQRWSTKAIRTWGQLKTEMQCFFEMFCGMCSSEWWCERWMITMIMRKDPPQRVT